MLGCLQPAPSAQSQATYRSLLLHCLLCCVVWCGKMRFYTVHLLLLSSLLLVLRLPWVAFGFVAGPCSSRRTATATATTNSKKQHGPPTTTTTTSTTSTSTSTRTQLSRTQAALAAIRVPNFCSHCGSPEMKRGVPPGGDDDRERAFCRECGHVAYSNPKIVVACVILDETGDRCLLGRRAIEPRAGYWGFPQGFLEDGETSRQAAVREADEELRLAAPLDPSDLKLRAVYNLPGSVQLVYEARVDASAARPAASTKECSAIAFFERDSLPELCFPTVQWALDHCWSRSSDSDAINNNNNTVQQKTKAYDAAMDQWTEEEDEPIMDTKPSP